MRSRMSPRPRARATRRKPRQARPAQDAGPLQYKVVELSSVDELSLERTLNEWAAQGWALDGIQFAMRDSSKRPSMAFVLFTRQGAPAPANVDEGRARLQRLAESPDSAPVQRFTLSAHDRLRQLAGDLPESGDSE